MFYTKQNDDGSSSPVIPRFLLSYATPHSAAPEPENTPFRLLSIQEPPDFESKHLWITAPLLQIVRFPGPQREHQHARPSLRSPTTLRCVSPSPMTSGDLRGRSVGDRADLAVQTTRKAPLPLGRPPCTDKLEVILGARLGRVGRSSVLLVDRYGGEALCPVVGRNASSIRAATSQSSCHPRRADQVAPSNRPHDLQPLFHVKRDLPPHSFAVRRSVAFPRLVWGTNDTPARNTSDADQQYHWSPMVKRSPRRALRRSFEDCEVPGPTSALSSIRPRLRGQMREPLWPRVGPSTRRDEGSWGALRRVHVP